MERLERWKRAPLADWAMTGGDCIQYCYDHRIYWYESAPGGEQIRLYDILDRVSCWCCRNKNLKELRNIYKILPEYWQKLRDLQAVIKQPMKGHYKGDPVGVFELEERFKAGN